MRRMFLAVAMLSPGISKLAPEAPAVYSFNVQYPHQRPNGPC